MKRGEEYENIEEEANCFCCGMFISFIGSTPSTLGQSSYRDFADALWELACWVKEQLGTGSDRRLEVEIKQGLKSIGKNAFYFCTDLQKITIPSSVTSMDEDALWSGHYGMDDRHIVSAEIYAPSKSYAVKYAKEHGIDYVPSDKNQISKAKISGVKKSYVYKGKAIKPKVTVKLGGKTLKKGQDYTVSYVNNKAPGTATVKIKGKNSYYGTVQKSFVISY